MEIKIQQPIKGAWKTLLLELKKKAQKNVEDDKRKKYPRAAWSWKTLLSERQWQW